MFRISFFVDDKHLASVLTALSGKARELQVEPVINAKKKGNGVAPHVYGNLPELVMDEIRKQKLVDVNAKSVKDIVEYVGGNANSYYHVLRQCMKVGELKKQPSKLGNTYVKYIVQPVKK